MLKKQPTLAADAVKFVLILSVAVLGVYFVVMGYSMEVERRKQNEILRQAKMFVEKQASIIVRTHGKDYIPPKDYWGTPIEWNFKPDPKVHVAIALSAGPDKKFNTGDDIGGEATDFNKTGIVAEWAGSKVKEAAKGFFRGLIKPSNHSKEEDEG